MEDIQVKKARNGDTVALNYLLERYRDVAFSIAYRILRDNDDAEDIVQESFIKVFQSIGKFRNESKFSTWLYRIVYNESLRGQKKDDRLVSIDTYELDEIIEYPGIENALKNLMENERKKIIITALDKIHPNESLILTLFYLEEKSIKEIQTITNFSKSNIKVMLHRGRNNLYGILNRMLTHETEEMP